MTVHLTTRPERPQLDIGAMLVSSYINTILYGLAMLCVYIYATSQRSKRDPLFIKIAVTASAILDTAASLGVCASVYYLTVISHWGKYDPEFRSHWAAAMWFICFAFTETIVQSFLIRRTKNRWFTLFVILLIIYSLECNLFLGISTAIGAKPVTARASNISAALESLCSTLVADLSTTFALLWQLKKADTYSRITKHVVRRISVVVVITGIANCLVLLASIITWLIDPTGAVSTAIASIAGRVYSLTMLFTLLYRDMITDDKWIQVNEGLESSNFGSSGVNEGTARLSNNIASTSRTSCVSEMVFSSPRNQEADSSWSISSGRLETGSEQEVGSAHEISPGGGGDDANG